MSIIKLKIEVHAEIDTDDYSVPADGRIILSLTEDITETLETNMPLIVKHAKITKTGIIKNEEVRDND